MAENLELKDESTTNPCCKEWEDKVLKLKQRLKKSDDARNALKMAVGIYKEQFDMINDTNLQLQKDLKDEKLRTENERKEKEKELAARVSLENEVSALKSELLSSSQKGGSVLNHADEELKTLKGQILEREKEISSLQERINVAAADLENEKLQTENERKEKEKELAARVLLEEEVSALKSELLSSSKKGGSALNHANEELKTLKGQILESEKEISSLQERINVAAADKRKAIEEKNRADGACESFMAEKSKLEKELSNLKAHLLTVDTEVKRLRNDLQKEKARVDSEKKRADEALKTAKTEQAAGEVFNAEKTNVVKDLSSQILETEISRLKEQLEKEKKRADSESKKAEVEKKRANKVREMLKAGQSTGDDQSKLVEVERKKAEELSRQVERLKCEADEARSKLFSESSKLKEANKKFEAEKKRLTKEKKKAEQQQKIAEMSSKNALEDKQRADRLHQQLEEYQQKYATLKKEMEETLSSKSIVQVKTNETNETKTATPVKQKTNRAIEKESELKKAAEMYKLQAMSEKTRADKLVQKLEEAKKGSNSASKEDMTAKSAEMKLLKDKLKLEKAKVKHANEVVELEKDRKKVAEEELNRLKLEFAQFSNRVGFCSCFAFCNSGNVNTKRKFIQIEEESPLHLQSEKEFLKPSECFRPSSDDPTLSLPISGTCTESTSGTASKLDKRKLDNSALVPSMASFSDRQLVGSQGKYDFSNTKPTVVADNNIKSPLKVKNKEGNTKKRKRLMNAIESIEHLYSEGKTWQAKIAKNMSDLHGILGQVDKPLKEGMTSEEVPIKTAVNVDEVVDLRANEKNVVKTIHRCNDDDELLKRILDGDYMKLLELDSFVEEEKYLAAVTKPLLRTLPIIEFKTNQSDELNDSGQKGIKGSRGNKSESESECAYDDSSYIVVFPEMSESNSLTKILHTTITFMNQCFESSHSDYVVKNLVLALSADETLSSKEKVCVFFSLFLKRSSNIASSNFNGVFDNNFMNAVDIFSQQFKKVMSDVETRTKFVEVCNVDELIALIQDFIINERVLLQIDSNSETPKFDILLNNESVSLSFHKASFHHLVLGAVVLASVCSAFDRIDSICETSFTISSITSSSSLTFLHVFAHICGEKLSANDKDHSLIMTVVNSLVTYCEKEILESEFPSCATCPFSVGAVSMEELASLLLQKLLNYGSDCTSSNLIDVLSLLELLASKMNWCWICDNIVNHLLKLLEECVTEIPLTAVFILIGQIARLGIKANGLENAEVEKIRVKLTSFISRSTSMKISLSVQLAAVKALTCTMQLNFEVFSKNSVSRVSSSTPTDCIQKWLSSLSDEEKLLSVKLLSADGFSCRNV